MRILLYFIPLLNLFSCEGDIYVNFRWTDMTPYNASNAGEFPETFEGEAIDANIYCIQLDMHTTMSESDGRYYDTEHPPNNSQPLEELQITSDQDFNDTLPAGSNLTAMFRILNGSYFNSLPADGSEGYDINNQYSHSFRSTPAVEVINLLLIHPPTLGNTHTFEVIFTLRGGSPIFNASTNPIQLK